MTRVDRRKRLRPGRPPRNVARSLSQRTRETAGVRHGIVAAEPRGLNRLYVALTRAVSTLLIVHAERLPAALQAPSQ